MAQLIKLSDYISRYQWNIYRYPSQYIRLKQENWSKLYAFWNDVNLDHKSNSTDNDDDEESLFHRWKTLFKRETPDDPIQEEAASLPKTEAELKQYFLDKLFPTQLKWASSTVTDLSFVDGRYTENKTLKYFLQRFPDTYLLMYYPIFNIKKAPIDGGIILISPVGIDIIYLLDKQSSETIHVTDERTWEIENNHSKKSVKQLSPVIALKRTEKIVRSVISHAGIQLPVNKIVLARNNHMIIHSAPYKTIMIDKRDYPNWFKKKRELVSPLKSQQLKAAEALLKQCLTTAVKRPEWEDDNETNVFTIDRE